LRRLLLKIAATDADTYRMSGLRRPGVIGALAVAVALVLSGGVLAATGVGGHPTSALNTDSRIRAAGVRLRGVDAEQATVTSSPSPTLVTLPSSPPSTVSLPAAPVPPRSPSVTRPAPGSTTTTTRALPQVPATATTLVTTVPAATGPQTTSWSADRDGVSLRMRMEPAAPVPGQPVRFIFDISSVQPCCATGLNFGDSQDYLPVAPGNCSANSNVTDFAVSHTYEHPGVYKVRFLAATIPCHVAVVDGTPVPPTIVGADITACIAVGTTATVPCTSTP
jgi:hypothetical protein